MDATSVDGGPTFCQAEVAVPRQDLGTFLYIGVERVINRIACQSPTEVSIHDKACHGL